MTADSRARADHSERRGGDRMDILGDLRGEIMVYQAMTIREISYSGAQIETAFPLQLDSLHDVRLELGDAAVVLKGRVVHCSITDMDRELVAYRSGLEFVEPGTGVRTAIAGFIDAVKAQRLPR